MTVSSRPVRIFISFASEDRQSAEQIHFALLGAGFDTFYDKESLPPADDFNSRIRAAVAQSDLFIFLVSPDAIERGSYALTELHYARLKWPHPKGRVLPVMLREVRIEEIPTYLASVTILEPEGNPPAEILLAISRLAAPLQNGPSVRRRRISIVSAVAVVLALGIAWAIYQPPAPNPTLIGHLALTDQEPAAGGLLVDLDPLTVTWLAHGNPEDIRVFLESMQTSQRSEELRASSSEGSIRFPPEAYHRLLANRERNATNRIRAVIQSRSDNYASVPENVRVGLRVLTLADTDGVTVAAMIDNNRIPFYDFEAKVIVSSAAPQGKPISIGPDIPYTYGRLGVPRPGDYDWNSIKAVYLGPDDPRIVRTAYLVDNAITQHHRTEFAVVGPYEVENAARAVWDNGIRGAAIVNVTSGPGDEIDISLERTADRGENQPPNPRVFPTLPYRLTRFQKSDDMQRFRAANAPALAEWTYFCGTEPAVGRPTVTGGLTFERESGGNIRLTGSLTWRGQTKCPGSSAGNLSDTYTFSHIKR
jgi:hypothetical protein